jgi:hypothetical protein
MATEKAFLLPRIEQIFILFNYSLYKPFLLCYSIPE